MPYLHKAGIHISLFHKYPVKDDSLQVQSYIIPACDAFIGMVYTRPIGFSDF